MKIHKIKYLVVVVIVALVVVSAVTLTKSSRTSPQTATQEEKRGIDKLPTITSCVKNIKIVKKEIRNSGAPDGVIAVEVENTSDVGIIAISLESVKDRVDYYVLESSFEADVPIIIIKPHGTRTITIETSNISPDARLQIGSVTYVDGTEEGCAASLELMRESKKAHEKKRDQKKESPK
jgi:hypothetical protein